MDFHDTLGDDNHLTVLQDSVLSLLLRAPQESISWVVEYRITGEFFDGLLRKGLFAFIMDGNEVEVFEVFLSQFADRLNKTLLPAELDWMYTVQNRCSQRDIDNAGEIIGELYRAMHRRVNIARWEQQIDRYRREELNEEDLIVEIRNNAHRSDAQPYDYRATSAFSRYKAPDTKLYAIIAQSLERRIGVMPGEGVHITGITGGRKTTMAIATARIYAMTGESVVYISTEMSEVAILSYLIAMEYFELTSRWCDTHEIYGDRRESILDVRVRHIQMDLHGEGGYLSNSLRQPHYQRAYDTVMSYADNIRIYDGHPDSEFPDIIYQRVMHNALHTDAHRYGPARLQIIDHARDSIPDSGDTSDLSKMVGMGSYFSRWLKAFPDTVTMILSQMSTSAQKSGTGFTMSGSAGGGNLDNVASLAIQSFGHYADGKGLITDSDFIYFAITKTRFSGAGLRQGARYRYPIEANSGYIPSEGKLEYAPRTSKRSAGGDSGEAGEFEE